jgi:lysozyme family protein
VTDADILDAIIKAEGGYVDHAADLGGPTNMGITAATLGEWRRLGRNATRAEVKALTRAEAEAIYAVRYLRPFDAIQDADLRHYLIDLGVLRGPRKAAQMLQDVVGVEADGWIGPETLKAMKPFARHLLVMLIGIRFAHIAERVRELPSQKAFMAGWRNRNARFLP